MPGYHGSNIERFMSKVHIQPDHWIWLAGTNNFSYPQFWDNEIKKVVLAHRWSYEYFTGPIPKGCDLHHRCEIVSCVRPECSKPLTRLEHLIVSPKMISSVNRAKTHCPKGHTYDKVNTYYDYDGNRHCRICRLYSSKKIHHDQY